MIFVPLSFMDRWPKAANQTRPSEFTPKDTNNGRMAQIEDSTILIRVIRLSFVSFVVTDNAQPRVA